VVDGVVTLQLPPGVRNEGLMILTSCQRRPSLFCGAPAADRDYTGRGGRARRRSVASDLLCVVINSGIYHNSVRQALIGMENLYRMALRTTGDHSGAKFAPTVKVEFRK
jgi:hypothetical protein